MGYWIFSVGKVQKRWEGGRYYLPGLLCDIYVVKKMTITV